MLALLWLIPSLPLAGFVALVLLGGLLPRRSHAWIGAGSVGLSAILVALIGIEFLRGVPHGQASVQWLWSWISVASLTSRIGFALDPLSLVYALVITWVGFFIHLYSAEFIEPEEHRRFFAYMNLFVASMLTLVLADNLLFLFLGWEGVGLCSYLLIGFWYCDPANGRAAQKAFWVTRTGDTAFAIGLFLLFTQLGTLSIPELMQRAAQQWPVGSGLAVAAAALLLGGAVGKSAQLPLQVWLPDAMAGPTPVSALIHAATMVTAGVYLIARLHVLYSLAPTVQMIVGVIGALTLLLAACSALVQRDIKRVLAYSTISQIGYMFLALGVGAWAAALFHFMTHAFFKALLFLAAGAVILAMHHEHDIFRMGGLRKELPLTFWTFMIGAASLAGLPLVTAGFFSKDWILWEAWSSPAGGFWLWAVGVLGAFLTALYSFRLVFLVFFGERSTPEPIAHRPGLAISLPLIALAILSVVAGYLEIPRTLGRLPLFSQLMEGTFLPAPEKAATSATLEIVSEIVITAVVLAGIALAYLLFLRRPALSTALAQTPWGSALARFWFHGWEFDRVYDRLLVRPFLWLAQVNQTDLVDRTYEGIAWLSRLGHQGLHLVQTGQVRWYAAVLAAGSVTVIAIAILVAA